MSLKVITIFYHSRVGKTTTVKSALNFIQLFLKYQHPKSQLPVLLTIHESDVIWPL